MTEIIHTPLTAEAPVQTGTQEILSLVDYKALRNITDTKRDAQIEVALPAAEDAVVRYAQRAFNQAPTAATRSFVYEGQSILEIDDCQSVTSVKFDGAEVATEAFLVGPQGIDSVFYYIELLEYPWDTYDPYIDPFLINVNPGRRRRKRIVEVTATFGWPYVPASIRQAVSFLVDEFAPEEEQNGKLAAEAIVDYSKVWDRPIRGMGGEPAQLPPRVMELIDPFRRVLL